MNLKEFNPYIRYINKVTIHIPYPEMVCAHDFRLLYITNGSFTIKFKDTELNLHEGDFLTIPPATPYKLNFDKNIAVSYYILNFDFDQSCSHQAVRAPVSEIKFKKENVFSTFFIEPFGSVLLIHNVYTAEQILQEALCNDTIQTIYSKHIQSALIKYLLTYVVMNYIDKNKNSKTETLINDIKNYVNKNYHLPITNISIAKHFGYHPYHLNSLFSQSQDMTLHKYIAEIRLKHVKEMLALTDKPIYEIAYACGFNDSSYFCRFFLNSTGIKPKEYRNLSK